MSINWGPVVKLNLENQTWFAQGSNAEINRWIRFRKYWPTGSSRTQNGVISEHVNAQGVWNHIQDMLKSSRREAIDWFDPKIYCNLVTGDLSQPRIPNLRIHSLRSSCPGSSTFDESAGFTFTSQQLEELITPRTKASFELPVKSNGR